MGNIPAEKNAILFVMMELMLEECITIEKLVLTLLKLLGFTVAHLLLVKMELEIGSAI